MSFDINKHEWSDSDINNVYACKNCSLLLTGKLSTSKVIKKQDAIAIAKHFGLTAEDLNQPPQIKE